MTESWGLSIGAAIVLGAWLGPAAVVIMMISVLALQLLRQEFNVLFLIVVSACCLAGALRMAATEPPVAPPGLAESTGAIVRVDSLPRSSASGDSVVVLVSKLTTETASTEVPSFSVLIWLPAGQQVAPGDILTVGWSVDSVGTVSPGFGRYVNAQGAAGVARVWWVNVDDRGSSFIHGLVHLRSRISQGLQDVLPGDAGALAAGIVTGDDSGLSDETRDNFLATGTTHITAVSGSNVAMVLAIWNLVIPAGRNRRLLAIQFLIIVSIWAYAILVGLEPPALRAAIMASLVLFGSRFGRRPDLLTLLVLTSAAMVLWNPAHVRLVGFWLSVVATGAIITRVPSSTGIGWKATGRGMIEGVALAQIATLPIILWTFGTWTVTSVIANALLAPLMWATFPLCFMLAAVVLVAPFLAPLMAVVPLIPLNLSLQIVGALSSAAAPFDIQNAGVAGLIAVIVPCVIAGALLSRDARRWGAIVAKRWADQPALVASALIGPLAGVMVALLWTVIIS